MRAFCILLSAGSLAVLSASKWHCYPATRPGTGQASPAELTSFAFYLTTVLGNSR